jgi:gamma-glutamylcyclotransferase (GGCT)/AIG2-like uncharacterized protein YtfP
MKKIAVYGSLRAGFGNHVYVNDSDMLSREVVNIPFRMVSLGGFPGLIPADENHDITIEIYSVTDQVYRNVERLEGYPNFYQKATINTSQGEVEVYILEDEYYKKSTFVESGDWAEFRRNTSPAYY